MSRNPKKWDFQKPKDFRLQYLRLPKYVRPRLAEVMTLLSQSDNPQSLGKKKTTLRGEFYAIRLSDYYRLSYYVLDSKDRIIQIIRVGDKRFVQGKK